MNDKIAIEGKLVRKQYTLSDGKKKHAGFVVAKAIEKVQLRARKVDDDVVEDEAINNNNN